MDIYVDSSYSPPRLFGKGVFGDSLISIKSSPLQILKVKHGDMLPLTVHILNSQSATNLQLGFKERGKLDGDLIVYGECVTPNTESASAVFSLLLDVRSESLNALFEGDVTAVLASAEFSWVDGEDTRLSETLDAVIVDDLLKGVGEGDLLVLPAHAVVDQAYDPNSTQAQSGKAVAQSIDEFRNSIESCGVTPVLELNHWGTALEGGIMYTTDALTDLDLSLCTLPSEQGKCVTCELHVDTTYAVSEGIDPSQVIWPESWEWVQGKDTTGSAPSLEAGKHYYFAIRTMQGKTVINHYLTTN